MKTIVTTITLLFFIGLMVPPVYSIDLKDGLVAYWDLNEIDGDMVSDVSGNGHDGMLIGDPQWTMDGKFDGGIEFDRVGDFVSVPYHEDLNPETFSICAWTNVAVGSSGFRAVVSSRDEPPISGYIIYAADNNTWQFWTGSGATPWSVITGPSIEHGQWEHVAATYADGTMKFYMNGEIISDLDADINLNSQRVLLIGAGANERNPHEYLFQGKIDEVRVYNRELAENEIAAVMESDSLSVEASGKLTLTWGQLKIK